MKTTRIKALMGAGALSLAFLGGIALAPSLVSGAAAQVGGTQTTETTDNRGHGADPLATAAQYIGITLDQLRSEMGTTKSLADVAVAHGKTRDGLIQVLTAAESQRIAELVDHKGAPQRPGGPGGPGGFGPRGHGGFGPGGPGFAVRVEPFPAAATYLGISAADLQTKLRSGQTLAQIAAATSGKTRDGLIAAIVHDEATKIDQAVKDGKLTADQATKIKADLTQRVTQLVDHSR